MRIPVAAALVVAMHTASPNGAVFTTSLPAPWAIELTPSDMPPEPSHAS